MAEAPKEKKPKTLPEEEEYSSLEPDDLLKTHLKINRGLCGNLVELRKDYARVQLVCTKEMIADETGLIHGGFTFGAADFAAMAAINDPYVVLIGSKSKFLAPCKLGDTIIFEATASFDEARKRDVTVVGMLNEIKIYEGMLTVVILEEHVLSKNGKKLKDVPIVPPAT